LFYDRDSRVLNLQRFFPAQTQPDATSKRRVVERSAPVYPPLARNLALEGVSGLKPSSLPMGASRPWSLKASSGAGAGGSEDGKSMEVERAPRESSESVEVKFSRE